MTKTANNYFNLNLATSGLLVVFLLLGLAYIYLVNTSVFLVNERRQNEEAITEIEANLAVEETAYLAKMATIDKALALSFGFVETPKDSNFVYRDRPLSDHNLSFSR
ncbi:MAG: hypothetical protein COX02_00035 [Candidatus Vogelbacteria bacterium CG22_combo_CG10-13_8_21_14_all_37_9]|uniref:Cell division protein FtsL n=1 Tax=Candidatus Vogelbacteria bacterium CG22_combo_CG10-13_8_21_14_all_37_9 TaxID=1975046 RepID=A0A2H0BLB9_9BACT|nr:MAG: hypothetical protein COX02_00035 [Candidatus Vogelbacteria bacterium CG22_combo_CG10-13_8_21_14_all_37_9]